MSHQSSDQQSHMEVIAALARRGDAREDVPKGMFDKTVRASDLVTWLVTIGSLVWFTSQAKANLDGAQREINELKTSVSRLIQAADTTTMLVERMSGIQRELMQVRAQLDKVLESRFSK